MGGRTDARTQTLSGRALQGKPMHMHAQGTHQHCPTQSTQAFWGMRARGGALRRPRWRRWRGQAFLQPVVAHTHS